MSYYAKLQTDNDLELPLVNPDGWTGGTALIDLIAILEDFCAHFSKIEIDKQEWLVALLRHSTNDFCSVIQPLLSSWYIYMDKDTFSSEEAAQRWQTPGAFLAAAEELIQVLAVANPKPIPEVDLPTSLQEVRLLRGLVVSAIRRRATKVRIVLY